MLNFPALMGIATALMQGKPFEMKHLRQVVPPSMIAQGATWLAPMIASIEAIFKEKAEEMGFTSFNVIASIFVHGGLSWMRLTAVIDGQNRIIGQVKMDNDFFLLVSKCWEKEDFSQLLELIDMPVPYAKELSKKTDEEA